MSEKSRNPSMKLKDTLMRKVDISKKANSHSISILPESKRIDTNCNVMDDVTITNNEPKFTSNIQQHQPIPSEINEKINYSMYGEHEAEIEKLLLYAKDHPSTQNVEVHLPLNKYFFNNSNEEEELDPENHTQDVTRGNTPSILQANERCTSYNSDTDYIPSEEDECLSSDDNINTGRKRRRVAEPDKWKRQVAKRLRMQGKEYTGFLRIGNKILQNQSRPARKMGPKCDMRMCSKTKKRQCILITERDRKQIFKMFWSKLDWNQKKIYVINHVEKSIPLRRYTKHGSSRREKTLSYYLTIDNKKMQVCKKTFLATLAIGEFTVRSWIVKSQHGMTENRKQRCQSDKNSKRELIEEFFDALPKLPSHYARKESKKLYLQTDIKTITELYKIYNKFCHDSEKPELIASRKLFDQVFKSKNLAIYTLKKDKCDTCEGHRNGNVEEIVYKEHIAEKERTRSEKEQDKVKANNNECTVLTMDLEAVRLAPFLYCSGYYYKTKLCCHNFTIYNLSTHHARCYWFTECDADLSASTFASCVIDYLEECCKDENRKIIIYSDGCTAQNRNVTLANALLDFSMKKNIEIEQKILVVGHTQMECDSVHASIERKLKNREIHVPSEYATVTKEARTKPFPYDVKIPEYSFFKNYAAPEMQLYSSIRPGRKKGDPCVTDIRMLKYNPKGTISVKLKFEGDFMDLPQRPKKRPLRDWPQLHQKRLKIAATKYKHLQELKFALPRDVHSYYDQLPHFN